MRGSSPTLRRVPAAFEIGVEELAGVFDVLGERVGVAGEGDLCGAGLALWGGVAISTEAILGGTPAASSHVAAVCRASWRVIG